MPIFSEQHSTTSYNSSVRYASSAASSENPSPPYSVPFTVSLLISESLFTVPDSPASTLIIPFIRKEIPYAYFIISIMEFVTAFLIKYSYGSAYSLLSSNCRTAFPDMNELRQVYRSNSSKKNAIDPSNLGQGAEDTPLFPRGMTFNISFSSPFSAPRSKASTLFTIELKEIRNIPGYVVPLAGLILYFLLKAHYQKK